MTDTARRLVEAVAKSIYENRQAFRHGHGLNAFDWPDLSEQTRESYREMARAACAAMQGYSCTFGRPKRTRREQVRTWWKGFVARNFVADDPLDQMENGRRANADRW